MDCAHLLLAIQAAGCVLNYARETQQSELAHCRGLRVESSGDSLVLDTISRRNLEIDLNLNGGFSNTLASVLDHCATAMGSRLLRRWLHRPIRSHAEIRSRQQAVQSLIDDYCYEALQPLLKQIGDIERILARVALRSARPRDLAKLREALQCLPAVQAELQYLSDAHLTQLAQRIAEYPALAQLLQLAINEKAILERIKSRSPHLISSKVYQTGFKEGKSTAIHASRLLNEVHGVRNESINS